MNDTIKAKALQAHPFVREGNIGLNPAQAGWVVREMGFNGNRKLSPVHVEKLAEYMRRAQWLDKSTLDFARLPDGRMTLVNGHHRLTAQAKTSATVIWNVVIHDVADDAAIKALYYRFDTEVRKRSSANIVGGVGLANALGVSRETAKALWTAAPLIANGMTFQRYRQAEAGPLMDDLMKVCAAYSEQALVMQGCIDAAPSFIRGRLRRTSTFGLAMVTLKHQPSVAAEFWRGVCEDDGLSKGDPRKTLLLDMQSRVGASGLVAAHLMAGTKAWNAYFGGRSMQIIRVTGHSVKIDGTPFTVSA